MSLRLLLPIAVSLALAACRGGASAPPQSATADPTAAESPAIGELEPNDEPSSAHELGVPAIVDGAAGGKDVDWYRLPAGDAPRLLRLDATGPGDLVLQLYSPDGKERLIRAGAAGAGAPEVIDGVYQRGPLLARVSVAGKAATPYRLEVAARPYRRNAEAEPNGEPGQALLLVPGAAVTGTIAHEEDEDVWRLDLLPPLPGDHQQALKLELPAVAGLRPAIAVLDADGTLVAENRAPKIGSGVSFRNLAIGPGARLPFYAVVKSAWVAKKRTSAPDTPYRLLATMEPVPADLEEEPNDGPDRATQLFPPGRIGYLAPAGDVDWYAITVDRPAVARVVLSGVDGADMILDAPDVAAGGDAVRMRSTIGGVGEGEFLPGLWLPAGTSYVRISSSSRKVGDRWVRDYENPDQTYTLGITLRDAFPGDEIEPNNTPERATPLRPGGRARGFLYPYRDVDVFRLDVGIEDEGTLTAVVGAVPRVQVTLALRGGDPVDGNVPVIATAEVDKEAGEARLTANVEPGVYWLEVRGSGANHGDPYRLDVHSTFDG